MALSKGTISIFLHQAVSIGFGIDVTMTIEAWLVITLKGYALGCIGHTARLGLATYLLYIPRLFNMKGGQGRLLKPRNILHCGAHDGLG